MVNSATSSLIGSDTNSAASAPASPKAYNPTIDCVRIVAALVIALFHAGVAPAPAAEASVAFFVTTMVFFMVRKLSAGDGRARPPIASGALRLLRPWVVWTAIYSAAIIMNVTLKHGDLAQSFREWLPPRGTQNQLWYLLFAAALSFALSLISRRADIAAVIERNLLAAGALFAVASCAALTIWTERLLPSGLGIFLLYIPSALMGLLIFTTSRDTPRLLAVAGAATIFGVVLSASGIVGASQLIYGVPLYLFAHFVRLPDRGYARALGGIAMSVFLVHVLVIAFVERLPFVTLAQPDGAIAVVCMSLAAAMAIRWMKLEKYLQ
ncbi:MAG: acyltransferase family protein [Paracoccaceae bacterium]